MTLKDMMAADVNDVFLRLDDFAETVCLFPGGRMSEATPMKAVVLADGIAGSNEVLGDGRVMHHEAGVRERESLTLEIPSDIHVQGPSGTNINQDWFEIWGQFYVVKRVIRKDNYMQAVLVVKVDQRTTRKNMLRG